MQPRDKRLHGEDAAGNEGDGGPEELGPAQELWSNY